MSFLCNSYVYLHLLTFFFCLFQLRRQCSYVWALSFTSVCVLFLLLYLLVFRYSYFMFFFVHIIRPTFWKIWKRKAVEDFSPVPYLATLLNCALWVFYGMPFVHPNSLLIVTINGFGFVVEALYIIMFLIYGKRKIRVRDYGPN